MSHPRIILPMIALTAVLAAAAPAVADCVDYAQYLHRIDYREYPDVFFEDAVLAGDVLLAAGNDQGLLRIAMTDGIPGEILDSLSVTAYFAHRVAVSGDLAFVASYDGWVSVVRLGAVGAMEEIAALQIPDQVCGLAITTGGVLLATCGQELAVIDVSDPTNPWLRHTVSEYVLEDLAVEGVIAYLALRDVGLRIYDVADPDAPFLLAQVALPGGARDLDLDPDTDRLAVAGSGEGVRIIDVDAPWAPAVVNHVDVSTTCLDLAGDQLRVNWSYTLAVFELDDQGGSRLLGRVAAKPSLGLMIPVDERLLNLGGDHAETFDLAVPVSYVPEVHGVGAHAYDFAVDAQRVVTVTHEGWLQVFGRAADGTLSPLGDLQLDGQAYELALAGDWAFVALADDGRSLLGVDLADPAAPQLAWSLDLGEYNRRLALDGDLLAVHSHSTGLHLIDVADPAAPVVRGQLSISGHDLALAGGVAYLPDNFNGLAVVDVSDPDHPAFVRTVATAGLPRAVGLAGELLVTLDYDLGFTTLDISDPLWPQVLGTALTSGGGEGEVVILDRHAYLAGSGLGFQVFDLADPAAPVHRGAVYGGASRIQAHGGLLYTNALLGDELRVYPPQCADPLAVPGDSGPAGTRLGGALRILDVAPNPCNPRTAIHLRLDAAGALRCGVYDLRGRRVATLADGWRDRGDVVLTWDGRDGAGRPVAAGTYLVQAVAAGVARTARVSIVR